LLYPAELRAQMTVEYVALWREKSSVEATGHLWAMKRAFANLCRFGAKQ
jgi:hypothetical protein